MTKSKGTCRWCGKRKKLVKAHILPKAFYDLQPNVMHFAFQSDSVARFRRAPRGLYDPNILCATCDGDVIGLWDTYAARTFLAPDAAGLPTESVEGIPIFTVRNADPELTQRFALSVIWRASVAPSVPFSLGDEEQRVLEVLQSKNAACLQQYSFLLTHNLDPKARPITTPSETRAGYIAFHADQFHFAVRLSAQEETSALTELLIRQGEPVLAIGRVFGETPMAHRIGETFVELAGQHGWPKFPRKTADK